MPWFDKEIDDALTRAVQYIIDSTGGCPLDTGKCVFPSMIEECDTTDKQHVWCWRHHFLTQRS